MVKVKGLLIGINGKAGSGKDTVADFILENKGFVKVALADPIKRLASDLWDWDEDTLWGSSEKRNKPDKRYSRIVPSFDVGDAFEASRFGIEDPGEIKFLSPREALQWIGTQGLRHLDEDVWVRYTIRTANKLFSNKYLGYNRTKGIVCGWYRLTKAVITSDIRFYNEVKMLKKAGAKLIRVKRPGAGLQGEFGKHQSESEMDNIPDEEFDYIIQNNSSLEELKEETQRALGYIKSL